MKSKENVNVADEKLKPIYHTGRSEANIAAVAENLKISISHR